MCLQLELFLTQYYMVLQVQMATQHGSVSTARTVFVCYMVLQVQMATELSSVSAARAVTVC